MLPKGGIPGRGTNERSNQGRLELHQLVQSVHPGGRMEKYRQAEKSIEGNLVLVRSDGEPMNAHDWDTFNYKGQNPSAGLHILLHYAV